MDYSVLKFLHITFVTFSGLGFLVRGVLALRFSPLLNTFWARQFPHYVDSGLLASALGMVWLAGISIPETPWIQAKLAGLVVHVLTGALALKRAKTLRIRWICLIFSCLAFAYIVTVALTRSPTGGIF